MHTDAGPMNQAQLSVRSLINVGDHVQTLQPELSATSPVDLIEWVPCTSRFRTPELRVRCLQFLHLLVEICGLAGKTYEAGMLRLQYGSDSL